MKAVCDLILSVKDAEDHDKWLKTRDLGIGGSDAAVIMGMNSYKSPYQLWMEKTGQVEPPDLSDNQYVYWGTKNEANIADWFQEETGKKVKRLGTLQSREYPFMLANVDRTVIGENAGLEIRLPASVSIGSGRMTKSRMHITASVLITWQLPGRTTGTLLFCSVGMKPSGSGLSGTMRTSRRLSRLRRNSGIWCRRKPRRPWTVPFPALRH